MPTSSPSPSEPHPRIRILYAEDVRELRDLARIALGREGHAIECAVDGVDAIEKLTPNLDRYDLLITDHHMPRMNGLELLANVRRMEFRGKVMVFSSELNPAIAAEYRELGVDRILYKPVYPSFLRQAIAELFAAAAAPSAS